MTNRIAVLALQGGFAVHRRKLAEMGLDSFEARNPEELADAAGLVIPGGESTTFWKFFESAPWEEAIRAFAAAEKPILGTCAGAIVLAREVTNPAQKALGLIDMTVERNAYGRQADSFVGEVEAPELGGTLPAVSYIVPAGASEHPPGRIQAGERFVRSLLNALASSSSWKDSAFTWTYDDWGGWYDHVKPPQVDRYGYGFRAPALLVSAYARRGHVDHTQLDFTSILKFIEENWNLKPLAARDAAANSLHQVLYTARRALGAVSQKLKAS